jgi:hypothetical protein
MGWIHDLNPERVKRQRGQWNDSEVGLRYH